MIYLSVASYIGIAAIDHSRNIGKTCYMFWKVETNCSVSHREDVRVVLFFIFVPVMFGAVGVVIPPVWESVPQTSFMRFTFP